MRTVKLKIAYDGTKYVGWQIQPNGVSIQGLIQDAIRKMTGEHTNLIGASRTDAGVHAMGQIAHFQTERSIPCDGFKSGLNSLLPPDIAILNAEDAHPGFHSRKEAKAKRYMYRILVSDVRQPLFENRCWHLQNRPDVAAMKEAALSLIGEKDFASFRASGCASASSVRRIDSFEIDTMQAGETFRGCEGELLDFTIIGSGFMRHMVRNIAGTLVDIGTGKIASEDFEKIIEVADREEAGRCAPASGLYLIDVIY